MTSEEICLNQKITLKLFLLFRVGPVSFAFDATLIAMLAVEVIGRPQISFCLGCELSLELCLENMINVNLSGCEFTKLPKLWAPNLEKLDISYCKNLVKLPELWAPKLKFLKLSHCKNLVEIDECYGSLEKLELWFLYDCIKLQFLPGQLKLKSLYAFHLCGYARLEKLPNFHPEMECLQYLDLSGNGIREVPSSIEHLTKLVELNLRYCKNLRDLSDSIYKLQWFRI
ncbi:disease resistance protein rpp4 [Quercus suber]|uniref:Disease resistance protein rpp4 n=1 Tax=Quercus suber TaxID=58331 RepID=A0AAW0KHS5_QUESU